MKEMKMTFRWYGENDPVSLEYISQIPGMSGIVSAVYDVPPGKEWSTESIQKVKTAANSHGLAFEVVESVPVHEDIKLGKPSRDEYIEVYRRNVKKLADAGVKVICYNFLPVFDWLRSDLAHQIPDGSTSLIYRDAEVLAMDPNTKKLSLPGWDESYTQDGLRALLAGRRDDAGGGQPALPRRGRADGGRRARPGGAVGAGAADCLPPQPG